MRKYRAVASSSTPQYLSLFIFPPSVRRTAEIEEPNVARREKAQWCGNSVRILAFTVYIDTDRCAIKLGTPRTPPDSRLAHRSRVSLSGANIIDFEAGTFRDTGMLQRSHAGDTVAFKTNVPEHMFPFGRNSMSSLIFYLSTPSSTTYGSLLPVLA